MPLYTIYILVRKQQKHKLYSIYYKKIRAKEEKRSRVESWGYGIRASDLNIMMRVGPGLNVTFDPRPEGSSS